MPKDSEGGRPEPLEEFVAELVELRAAAGNPSFRQMAARSGAVSHATLHQTIAGHKLQPWETVREFVRACDGDEDALHERWQRTRLALTEFAEADDDTAAAGRWRRWARGPKALVAVAASVAVIAVGGAVVLALVGDPPVEPTAEATRSASLKVSRTPAVPGDATRFIRDVSIPDGTPVKPGKKFVKTWEIQNVGSVHWHDRYLERIDPQGPGTCRTVERVRIEDTAPQEKVQISVRVTAPKKAPTECKVRWKMVDESGTQLFPSSRPVFFLVQVEK